MSWSGDTLRAALSARLDASAWAWLDAATARVAADPTAIATLFPAAGRHVGREPVVTSPATDPAPWTAEDAARALLLIALGPHAGAQVAALHRYGDADEQRAIVRALHLIDIPVEVGRRLVLDAARTNDPRLIRVALSPYGLAHLDDEEVAQIALKCVFSGVSLDSIDGLADRATPRLAQLLAGFALERVAAGRRVPADIWPLIDRYPPEELLTAISAEAQNPSPQRRAAAEAALAQREETQQSEHG